MAFSKEKIVDDLKKLGIKSGDLLNLKVSLRSVGKMEDGADTLISALLDVVGMEGTIVTESFVNSYPISYLKRHKQFSDNNSGSYAGALANAMVKYPGSYRSKHPIQKFCAIGKLAEELTQKHTANDYAYDVLKRMTEMGGKNLKVGPDGKVVGVGTTHVAIGILGFKQNYPSEGIYYLDDNGNEVLFRRDWSGGCEVGFGKFTSLYQKNDGIINRGIIGNAETMLTDMKKTLELELEILSKDPSFFMCGKCQNCKYSWEFSPRKNFSFILKPLRTYYNIKRGTY